MPTQNKGTLFTHARSVSLSHTVSTKTQDPWTGHHSKEKRKKTSVKTRDSWTGHHSKEKEEKRPLFLLQM